MTQGKSGSFELTGSKGMVAQVSWAEQYDLADNTHVISVGLAIKTTKFAAVDYFLGSNDNYGAVRVDGLDVVVFRNIAGSHHVVPGRASFSSVLSADPDRYPAPPWPSEPITGQEDGACEVSISVDTYGFGPGEGNGWHVKGGQTVQLTTLPRATQIRATDANIGSVSMVSLDRKVSRFRETVRVDFGGYSGYLTDTGGLTADPVRVSASSIPWQIPAAFYREIPDAPSASCTLTCTTYDGDTQIGQPQETSCLITAEASRCGPLVAGTVTDVNVKAQQLTGSPTRLIRYASDAKCIITATPREGAVITDKAISGQPVTGAELMLEDIDTGAVTFSARDSRGYGATATVSFELVPYVKLTCNPEVRRTDPTSGNAVLTISGDYYEGSFGAAANTLTVKYRIDDKPDVITVTPLIDADHYSATVELSGLDYRTSHEIVIIAEDQLYQLAPSTWVAPGVPLFAYGERDFTFHVPVAFRAGISGVQEDPEHLGSYYRLIGRDKVWINPPMVYGVEYRTYAFFGAEPVYTRAIYSDGPTRTFRIPGATRIIRTAGAVDQHLLPYLEDPADPASWILIQANAGSVKVTPGNLPDIGFRLQIWYTKG